MGAALGIAPVQGLSADQRHGFKSGSDRGAVTRRSPSPADSGQGLGTTRPGQPPYSFRGLIDHLSTLIRNQVRFSGSRATVPMLTEPTSPAGRFPPPLRPYPAQLEVARTRLGHSTKTRSTRNHASNCELPANRRRSVPHRLVPAACAACRSQGRSQRRRAQGGRCTRARCTPGARCPDRWRLPG
jgi:hypothetical protein